MEKVISTIILLVATGIAFYLLYINGYLVTNAKRAVMYVGSMRGKKASFTACTGYTKRVVRFKESETVRFVFDLDVSKGEVTMELLDGAKRCILRLDDIRRSADIQVEANKRYYLVFRFKSASGNYLLSWK